MLYSKCHYNITVEMWQIAVLFSFALCYCFELNFNSFENSKHVQIGGCVEVRKD